MINVHVIAMTITDYVWIIVKYMKIIGKHVLLQMVLQHMKLIIVISKFHVHMYIYSCVENCQQLLSIKVHNVMMAHTCKYTIYLYYENTATIKYTANHHIHLGHLVSQFLCQTVCTQGSDSIYTITSSKNRHAVTVSMAYAIYQL